MKKILFVSTLDSKFEESKYIINKLNLNVNKLIIFDIGIKKTTSIKSNINRKKLIESSGYKKKQIEKLREPSKMLDIFSIGAKKIINKLYKQNKFDIICSIGGGKGTALFSSIIEDLPLSVPKFIITSARPAMISKICERQNIIVFPTPIDFFGLNYLNRKTLDNYTSSILSIKKSEKLIKKKRKIIGITSFGVTTTAVNLCIKLLKIKNYDSVVLPANGVGGRFFEKLINEKYFDGIIDLTTSEIADEVVGGTASAGKRRLTSAIKMQIPQIVSTGAIDMVNFSSLNTVPKKFLKRNLYQHTKFTTLMRTNVNENIKIAKIMAKRLKNKNSKCSVIYPKKGFSDYDKKNKFFYGPKENESWLKTFNKYKYKNIELIITNNHINDTEFANTIVEWIQNNV